MHNPIIKRRRHSGRLRNACRAALIACLLLTSAFSLQARQPIIRKLAMASVDPVGDSLFITGFKAKMDSIRRVEKRPTVALVLSGGGAKGAAEVGALRLIEELEIPVDMVCGTSIGGLIGGLYSVGYRSDDLLSLFKNSDWDYILSDKIDESYRSYLAKIYASKVLIQVPLMHLTEGDEYNIKTAKGISNLTSSLPSGYAYGLNVENLFGSLTAGYQDDIEFKNLPIPFFCVASDVVTGKEKNWGRGSLNLAMRSTMSIPGLFDPVRTDGMVLVDGGTRNNFPADIVKAIGADYIVGIDLSESKLSYEEVNNVGDLAGRFISMLGNAAFDKNIGLADILIKPNVDGYNMLSFEKEAVDTLVDRGYKAALLKLDELLALKEKLGSYQHIPPKQKATDIRTQPIRINSIRFSGVTENEASYLISKLALKPGDDVVFSDINDAMSRLSAMETFKSVRYILHGQGSPFDLEFECHKSPIHRVGFGLRADTEEAISLLLNFGLNVYRIGGVKLDFSAKLGNTQKAYLSFSKGSPERPVFNIDAWVNNYSMSSFANAKNIQVVSAWNHCERIYFSDWKWKKFNLNAGVRNDYYGVKNILSNEFLIAKEDVSRNFSGDYLSLFADVGYYSFDNHYYPTKGASLTFDYRFEFAQLSGAAKSSYKPYHIFKLDLKKVHSGGGRFAFIWDLHLRSIIGPNDSHLGISNFVGGALEARYTEQQIPFIGFNNVLLCYDNVGVVNLNFRYQAWKHLYFSLLGGCIADYEAGSIFTKDNVNYAGGFEANLKTLVGPLKAKLQWSNISGWGAYLSFGYDF